MMMTSKRGRLVSNLLAGVLLLLLMFPLTGCGKTKIENPYEQATLAQAVSGESQNKLFKFELNEPEIIAVEGSLALLGEGDRIEFLFADDLSQLKALDTGYKLGVKRAWGMSPEVYLVLEHVIDGADTTGNITADGAPVFPSYRSLADFDRGGYTDLGGEVSGMGSSDRGAIIRAHGKQGSKVWMSGTLSSADVNGQKEYYLTNNLGKFELDGINTLGELFLAGVIKGGGETSCFGPLGETYRRSQQRETGITGPMTLEHFQFQDYLITNG